jgi:chromate reductase
MALSHVLAVSGSLRAASFNTQLTQILPALAPDEMIVEPFNMLGDLPLYNADLDVDPEPEAVARWRAAIRRADGIIIVTPEYSHSMPGVVKNALDWGSRPISDIPLLGKNAMVLVATPGRAFGFRALSDVVRVLRDMGVFVVPGPEVVINEVHTKITADADGTPHLSDPVAEQLIRVQLRGLQRAIEAQAGRVAAEPLLEGRRVLAAALRR